MNLRAKFWRLSGLALVVSVLCTAGIGNNFVAAQSLGVRAPDFVLKSFAGENLRLSEYRGEVVMLSFWASWCSDCREQLTEINDIHGAYAQTGLRSLTVSMDTNRRDTNEMIAELGMGFPVLHDEGREVSRLYDIESLPLVVLIDREGIVREVIEGHDRDSEQQYLEQVQALLTE